MFFFYIIVVALYAKLQTAVVNPALYFSFKEWETDLKDYMQSKEIYLNFMLASHTNRSSNNCQTLMCKEAQIIKSKKNPKSQPQRFMWRRHQVVQFSSVSLIVIAARRCVHTAAYSTAQKKNVLLRVKNELAVCSKCMEERGAPIQVSGAELGSAPCIHWSALTGICCYI